MRLVFAHPFVTLAVILLALSLPPALKQKSWKQFGFGLLVSVFGVMLPLFIFFFSAFLVPEWKGGCPHGWIDCFHQGKLALTPIVLWATAALYAVELFEPARLTRYGVVLGLFLGTIVATVCFLFGLVFVGAHAMALWLLVPLYVAVWHGIRAWQLTRAMKTGLVPRALAVVGSLPFWVWSVMWSRNVFEALPDKAPDCFVVTAAASGHKQFVGSFLETSHNGRKLPANQQLITLWQFEALWRTHAPASHAICRRVYNHVGPVVARRITSPWLADATYIAIKPMELVARLIVSINKE